jgi:hypothetical protein
MVLDQMTFLDQVRIGDPLCGCNDVGNGGTSDGSGALAQHSTYRVYEFSKPLNSGDPRDFALASGQTTGFYMSIRILNCSVFPTDYGDTTWPGSFGQMTAKVKIAP